VEQSLLVIATEPFILPAPASLNMGVKQKLETLHSDLTSQQLGKIPLVPGMPVMISTNFNVQAGVVNGCTGILKQIRYHVDSEGKCHATSCVIHTPNTMGENFPHLHEHHEDSIEMTFTHPLQTKIQGNMYPGANCTCFCNDSIQSPRSNTDLGHWGC
jgi:hypothetical protein